MKTNLKRFFSMLLALSLVFGLVVPANATKVHAHDHDEEAKQEASINMEAVLENITVNAEDIELEVGFNNYVVLSDPDFEADMSDPAIITLETELRNITVLDEETGESIALTDDQVNTILYLYSQYMDNWAANADVLGIQTPFFLSYNDQKDGLGVLGEMLVLAGVSVDDVRKGDYSFQDLQGTVELFLYADILGVQYYGKAVEAARDEIMQLIKESGAITEAQKLLVINDWLAHHNTFDMPYIMNNGKDPDEMPMKAQNPVDHEHKQGIYDFIYANYEKNLQATFETNIRDGLKNEFKKQYYTKAIKNIIYQGALAKAYENEELITKLKAELHWDEAYAAAEKEVYDEAYAEFMLNNHEHDVEVEFTWKETKDADGNITAWTCEKAEAACKFEGCTVKFAVAVETEEVTEEATCTEDGSITYTATATVTIPGIEGEDGKVGEFESEPKEAVIIAAGHKDENADNICDACKEVLKAPHVHEATVTITWNATGDAVEKAEVTCGEDCEDTLTATTDVTSKTTKEATCGAAGETVYTAAVTVKDSEGNAVEKVTVKNETSKVEIPATGEHVDAFKDNVCDVCGQDIPVEECNHEWADADCDTPKTCSVCGATEGEALGHNYVEGTCDRCGAADPNYVPACEHEWPGDRGDGKCTKCGIAHEAHQEPYPGAGYCTICGADIVITRSVDFAPTAVAEDGEDDEAEEEKTVEELADEYAKGVVEEKKAEIEEAVNESTGLNAAIEMAVTGGTEERDTTIEENCWQAAEEFATENADAIAADPVAFVDNLLAEQPEAAAQIHGGWDSFWADCETNGIPGMVAMFSGEIWPAVIEQFYIQGMVQQGMPEADAAAQAAAIMEADAEAIAADPYAYCVENFGEEGAVRAEAVVLDELSKMGIDGSAENNPDGRVSMDIVVALQMDTPQKDDMLMKLDQDGQPILDEDGNPTYMTPNEAIPVYSDMAAAQMTPGVINYWEGSHFGAFGMGTSVCLGYTKAFTYLVQCLHPEIYGVNGAETDMSVAANWKTRDEVYVYGEDGKIDINQNYVVDAVRVTFDASVTMYGETEDNFNSDHFWNAVKIDGKWYYADPCYTDVFTEVMMRDRVETDGQMNHLYFLFSHTAAVDMYDGNYKEIKSLYSEVATDETFEDAWFSRIKSNTYFADGYAYYLYDSTDMLTLMEEYENQNQNQENQTSMNDNVYKIVRHKLDSDDSGDGDTDYEDLIIFNYKADDDSDPVGRVWDEETSAMVDSELLTELWKKHEVCADIYPSIMINAALYNGKIYFNLANCILSYDIATNEIVVVKEYNTVHGVRDTTKPFGGMAFTTTTADNADFTFENHPIAGMTIKDDGNMYVSIATNLAFISGKADRCDPASEGFGYEYEESNYNSSYNSYMDFGDYDDDQLADFGYTKEVNDNDEFMWTANFVEKISMSTLTHSHSYEAVSVAATCGVDAYTENRCSSCGVIEAGTRVYEEGTALEHHYIEFEETFYTKDDGGAWNEGLCLVCTNCGYALTRPSKPSGQMAEQEGVMEDYEEALAIYEAAEATAGHDYVPTDATWAEDNSSVSFKNLSCSSVCPERKNTLDCLINDKYITVELKTTLTADAAVVETIGLCEEGVTLIYEAAGEAALNGMGFAYTARKIVELEPAACTYVDGVCSVCGNCAINRIYGNDRIGTALSVAAALKNTLKVEKFDAIILAAGGSGQDQTKFADALSGSYLASAKNAPILLYTKGDLAQANLEFIAEHLSEDGTIYLLGGNVSIPAEVEAALVEDGYTVKRLAGDDRYLTNLAILKEVGVEGVDEVLIAGGQGFADSLSASATGLPIMLVKGSKTTLTEAQIEFLKSVEGKKITILGGNAAVSAELEAAIEEVVGKDVDRVFGETREETSVMIAKKYFPEAKMALITYSKMYPDGLAGGVLANVLGAPLLLTKAGSESIANEYIEEIGIEAGYVLGGSAVMTDETSKAVFGLPEHAVVNVAYFTE